MALSSSLKGLYGEQRVKFILDSLEPYGVRYIDDASLPTANGGVTQIDFIVFSPSVLACLEVKTWYGKVYVPQDNDRWRVVYDKQIILPSNPVIQNDIHCRACMASSPNDLYYKNLLVFPSDPVIYNKKPYTCNVTDLISILMNRTANYTEAVLQQEYETLSRISADNYSKLLDKEMSRIIRSELSTNFFGD